MSCDLDLAALQLLHRMISAMVSKLQLESFSAERNADELMSEADAKDRHSSHQPPNAVHGIRARLGIARTIRQKHSIGLQGHHTFRQRLRRDYCHPAALTAQLPQNILLNPKVV